MIKHAKIITNTKEFPTFFSRTVSRFEIIKLLKKEKKTLRIITNKL